MEILVVRRGGMGDLIVTLPVLHALRGHHPQARITLAGDARWRVLAEGFEPVFCDAFEDATAARWGRVLHTPGEEERAWLRGLELVYACVADPDRSVRELFAGLGFREGSASGTGPRLIWCAPKPEHGLAALHFGRPLAAAGLGPVAERVDLTVPLSLKTSLAARAGRVDVTIHPGSSSPQRNQAWEFWVETARLIRAAGMRVAWAVSYAEEALVPAVRAEARAAGEFLLEGEGTGELAALLSLAEFHLGHDTGATHLAAALGRRVHAVFSVSDPSIWAPPGGHVRVWRRESVSPRALAGAVQDTWEARVQARRGGSV